MIQKVLKASIGEACFELYNMIRPGSKATPLSCFFGRRTHSHLPNQFYKECRIVETIQKRILNQFAVASRRGHFNHDVFKSGDRVCLQDPATRRWNILGTVLKELIANDGSTRSSEKTTDLGQELVRNGSHVRHSEREAADPEQRS